MSDTLTSALIGCFAFGGWLCFLMAVRGKQEKPLTPFGTRVVHRLYRAARRMAAIASAADTFLMEYRSCINRPYNPICDQAEQMELNEQIQRGSAADVA